MANRITEAQKEEINKLYYEIGVKAEVARRMGISAASVARYVIPGWKPVSELPEIDIKISKPEGPQELILAMSCHPVSAAAAFCEACKLTDEEWIGMKNVQAEYVSV